MLVKRTKCVITGILKFYIIVVIQMIAMPEIMLSEQQFQEANTFHYNRPIFTILSRAMRVSSLCCGIMHCCITMLLLNLIGNFRHYIINKVYNLGIHVRGMIIIINLFWLDFTTLYMLNTRFTLISTVRGRFFIPFTRCRFSISITWGVYWSIVSLREIRMRTGWFSVDSCAAFLRFSDWVDMSLVSFISVILTPEFWTAPPDPSWSSDMPAMSNKIH